MDQTTAGFTLLAAAFHSVFVFNILKRSVFYLSHYCRMRATNAEWGTCTLDVQIEQLDSFESD